ncbi:MAG: arsenite methyltransferase [Candidatus Humimicrobiaceae bacterium]
MKEENVKKAVRDGYAKVAAGSSCGCGSSSGSCCSPVDTAKDISSNMGYSAEELERLPEGANLGLGCGNPLATASLKKGEVVLDLGSGAGIDCFLAAEKVGPYGKVIGVDMTPEMLDKARENILKSNYENIEFRLGEIENLPVADNTVDIIISNCVINLASDKDRVFSEAFRVLKSGGRIMVSDIVLLKELPEMIRADMAAYVSCIAGAIIKDSYISSIKSAGFSDVRIIEEVNFPLDYFLGDATALIIKNNLNLSQEQIKDLENTIVSIKVSAVKQ